VKFARVFSQPRNAIAVAIALSPALARADAWTTEPVLSVGSEYSTNPTLAPGGSSGQAAVANADLPFEWRSGIHRVVLEPRVRLGASGGASGLGSDGYYFTGTYGAEWSRLNLSATGATSDDSSVIRQPDAGTLIRLPIRQRSTSAKFAASYELSERDSIEANADVRRQRYGTRPQVGLYDFNYDSAGIRYTRLMTPEHAVLLSADLTHYTLPGYSYSTDSANLSFGMTGVIAQLWQYRLNVGRSRLSTPTSADHPLGSVYTLTADRTSERLHVLFSIVQSLQPSGFGTLVLSRESSVSADWAASERLKTFFTLRRAKSSDAFFTLSLSERRYDSVSSGVEWALTEEWALRGDLGYVNSTYAGFLTTGWTAHALGASIGLTRRFARRSLT
jgi:hypothetical protein